jgi:hypothetical protein
MSGWQFSFATCFYNPQLLLSFKYAGWQREIHTNKKRNSSCVLMTDSNVLVIPGLPRNLSIKQIPPPKSLK